MKKKLAIILSHPVQYYSPLFKQLSARGIIDITVFYTWGEAATGEKYDPGFGRKVAWDIPLLEGYPYELLKNVSKHPGSLHFNGIVNPDIIASINSYHPDAILVFGWAFRSHLTVIRHFSNRLPVMFRGDSTLLDEQDGMKKFARYLFLRWVYKHVHTAVYVGKNNYDYYIKFGMKPAQLVWGPHAIDNERFTSSTYALNPEVNAFRQQFGIAAGDFVFLFAGKFEPKKDPVILLQAFLFAGFVAGVHLVFTGNGELEPQLKLLARDKPNVHFLGFQNQQAMPALYGMADVFVLPSQGPGETWGLAVNEAMACRKPVIVSDKCGCAPDLVEDGVNGYIFRAGDVEDLKQKMRLMYHNRNRLPAMQQAALQKVGAYSIDAVCNGIESAITKV